MGRGAADVERVGSELIAPAKAVRPLDHWYGIVVAVCVFFSQFGIYGTLNSYAVFEHQMTEDESLGKPSSTTVSFGNSVSNGLAPIISIFAGALCDRLGPRIVLSCAAVLVVVGWVAASFATSAPMLVVLYSIPCCIASACLSTPGSAAVSSWLDRRISLGMGIAYSGNGGGSSVIVPIAGVLAQNMSWRASFRIMAAFPAISLIAAMFVVFREAPQLRPPLSPGERRFLRCMLSSRAFWTLFLSGALFSFTFFSALYLIVPFAASYGEPGTFYAAKTRIDISLAASLFTWFGVLKWFGSLALGSVAHKTEPRIVYAISSGAVGVICCVWPLCNTYLELAVVAGCVGFAFAGMFATLPAMTARCFAGPFCGLGVGSTMAAFAVGGFAGPPAVMAIKAHMDGAYTLSFAVMGLSSAASGLICFIAGRGFLHHQPFATDDTPLAPEDIDEDAGRVSGVSQPLV